jgi:uncharacterized protein YkwD
VRRLNILIAIAAASLGGSLITAAEATAATHGRVACRASYRSSHVHGRGHSRCRYGRSTRLGKRLGSRKPGLEVQRALSLARASAIASVLATPCQNTQLAPAPGDLELVRNAVMCLVNRERAQNGEVPLVRNQRLEQAAESHGSEMIALDYFEHVSPTGETPVARIRDAGYIPNPDAGYVIGENLAWGTLALATPQAVVEAWIASPKHLANILESRYRETGIGIVPTVPAALGEGQPGATYAQEFGVIMD